MRKGVINMSRAWDIEKNLSPRQELNLWPSVHRTDGLTTELLAPLSWLVDRIISNFLSIYFFGLVDQPEGKEKSLEIIIHQELNFVPFYWFKIASRT